MGGQDLLLDTEVVTLKYSCRYWAHESGLRQSTFTTDRCPICRIDTLLFHGADLSAVDRKWSTPLHLGAANRLPAMLSLLLERGVSTSAKDWGGKKKKKPLYIAAEVGVSETVRILIHKDADTLLVDEQGRRSLGVVHACRTRSLPPQSQQTGRPITQKLAYRPLQWDPMVRMEGCI